MHGGEVITLEGRHLCGRAPKFKHKYDMLWLALPSALNDETLGCPYRIMIVRTNEYVYLATSLVSSLHVLLNTV